MITEVESVCKADTCCWTCIVVSGADSRHLKFFLDISQHGQFIAELQGCQHRVLVGQGEVSRTGESSVGIYPRSRVAEGVELLLVVTGVAATKVIVRVIDASPFTQQGVNDLVFLAVRCKDQWGDIVGEPVGMHTQNPKIKSIYETEPTITTITTIIYFAITIVLIKQQMVS